MTELGTLNVPDPWQFEILPRVHALTGDDTPIYGRSVGDGITVGRWNIVHDGTVGDLFHLTVGVNASASRSVADGVTTSGSPIITSATAAFVAGSVGGDLGKAITGTGIPAGSYIGQIDSATQVRLSSSPSTYTPVNATASGTGISFTIGAGPNVNGAVFAIGVDNGGTGFVIQNKSTGIGMTLNQLNTITGATAYMINADHFSAVAPFSSWRVNSTATTAIMAFKVSSAPAGATWMTFADNTGSSGQIDADDGIIKWRRNIEVKAGAVGEAPKLRVYEEIAAPSEVYVSAKTTGETGVRLWRWTGSGTAMNAWGILAETDRLKIKGAASAGADKGSETLTTMIEIRGNTQMGFFGVTPVSRASLAAAATDLATVITLANDTRTKLIALGVVQ